MCNSRRLFSPLFVDSDSWELIPFSEIMVGLHPTCICSCQGGASRTSRSAFEQRVPLGCLVLQPQRRRAEKEFAASCGCLGFFALPKGCYVVPFGSVMAFW